MEHDYQKLIFAYDSTGRREGFSFYNGNSLVGHYYYLYNAQGDVTGILNQNMTLVVRYTYDSWGKLIACEGNGARELGTLNPFRYRGYIYDEETKLYYLNSRYYDPETGRFINADVYISTGQGVLGYNMFAYCRNNPVNMRDLNGCLPRWLNDYALDGDLKANYMYEREDVFSHETMIHDYKQIFAFGAEFIGKIVLSVTTVISDGDSGMFFCYYDCGNEADRIGIVGQLINMFKVDIGIDSKSNFYCDLEALSLVHSEVSVGIDGVAVSVGVSPNETSYDCELHFGWWGLFIAAGCTYASTVFGSDKVPVKSDR